MLKSPSRLRLGVIIPSSRYGSLKAFSRQLYAALKNSPEVDDVQLLRTDGEDGRIALQGFQELVEGQLDALITFNSLFKSEGGKLFCDIVQVPTVFCLVDALYHFAPEPSEYAILGFSDRFHRRFAEEIGYVRVIDLPHAIDKPFYASPQEERSCACAMFSSPMDYQSYSDYWQRHFPKYLGSALEASAEELFRDASAILPEVLIKHLGAVSEGFPFQEICQQLDLYVKGRGRIALLQALEGIPIDLYGEEGWHNLLRDAMPHVKIHPPLDYGSVLEQMKRTKVVLSSCESVRDGGHERILAALACGCVVVARATPYLEEAFPPGSGVIYYRDMPWNALRGSIERALKDEPWRVRAVYNGQKRLEPKHLWSERAASIIAALKAWMPVMPFRDPV